MLAFSACNKTKSNTNRLDGGEWTVKVLTVDGVSQDELPSWNVSECDAYEASCLSEWKNEEGGISKFIWQFREKGQKFEISNQSETSGEHSQDEAVVQCQNFSGVYEVTEHKKKTMKFESSTTLANAGKKVVIELEKK